MKKLTLLVTVLLVGVALLGFSGGKKEEPEKAKPAAAAKGKYQEAPVLAQKFRQALSIAIDRERINKEVLFGRSNPGMMSFHSNTQWFRPEHVTKYGYYDPEKAKKWLDEIGVVDADRDGWREDPDGKDIHWVIEWIVSEAPYGDISEHVARGWKDIGLNVDHKLLEASLRSARMKTNKYAMWPWHGAFRDEGMFPFKSTS